MVETKTKAGLTDEEMKALRPDVPACGQTVFDCDSCSGGCPIVAKAQFKKVVEELEKHFEYTDASIRGGSRGFFFSQKEWQALLEEVRE